MPATLPRPILAELKRSGRSQLHDQRDLHTHREWNSHRRRHPHRQRHRQPADREPLGYRDEHGATASLSPSSLTFGNEPVDTTSSSQTVTLNNTGSAALSITSIAFTGADPADFTENNTCGSSVAAGGTCTIAISFTPSASGARTASLTITDNASGSPQSVALSGTGTHDVILTWTASTTSGIAGYNVYRGTTSGGESSTPLNSAPINGTTYADENVTAGTKYYYVVTAVASNGCYPKRRLERSFRHRTLTLAAACRLPERCATPLSIGKS